MDDAGVDAMDASYQRFKQWLDGFINGACEITFTGAALVWVKAEAAAKVVITEGCTDAEREKCFVVICPLCAATPDDF